MDIYKCKDGNGNHDIVMDHITKVTEDDLGRVYIFIVSAPNCMLEAEEGQLFLAAWNKYVTRINTLGEIQL